MVNQRDNVQPLGICQRFLKFLMNNLIGQGIRRVTLSRESVEVPIDEAPLRNANKSVFKTSSEANGEVVIEFRHIEARDYNWNHVLQDYGSSVPIPNKNSLIVTDDRTQIGVVKKGRHFEAAPAPNGTVAVTNLHLEETDARFRGHRPNGTVAVTNLHPEETDARFRGHRIKGDQPTTPTLVKGSAVGIRGKGKGKDIAIHHQTVMNGIEPADKETITMPQIPLRPLLLRSASNINEKADAFIRSRKEAMSKHYTGGGGVEPNKSS